MKTIAHGNPSLSVFSFENLSQFFRRRELSTQLRSSLILVLTVVFISLYVAALTGWIRPLSDLAAVARLEPMIFMILGYYFGRVPSQQNEASLKDEISRQTTKAEAANQIKEQLQKDKEAFEERIRNLKVVLRTSSSSRTGNDETHAGNDLADAIQTARKILDR